MKTRKPKTRIKFTKQVSPTPMTQAEWESAEDLLARMVARAIAMEFHPELFGKSE